MARAQDTMAGTNLQSAWMDDPEFLRGLVEAAVQRLLNAQFEASVGPGPYVRSDDRKGYRNGSYSRSLKTRVGQIELQVPRDREGALFSKCADMRSARSVGEAALWIGSWSA